jgi:hypothetical protein
MALIYFKGYLGVQDLSCLDVGILGCAGMNCSGMLSVGTRLMWEMLSVSWAVKTNGRSIDFGTLCSGQEKVDLQCAIDKLLQTNLKISPSLIQYIRREQQD